MLPQGWRTVTLRLVTTEPAKIVAFLARALDATGEYVERAPSLIKIGNSIVMVSRRGRENRGLRCFIFTLMTPTRHTGAPWTPAQYRAKSRGTLRTVIDAHGYQSVRQCLANCYISHAGVAGHK